MSDKITINYKNITKKGKQTLNFLTTNKYAKIALTVFLILILMSVAFHFRAQSWDLPSMERTATNQVENQYKQQIAQQVQSQNPQITQTQLEREVERQYKDFYRENRDSIDQQIRQTSEQYKSLFRDDDGNTYLVGIDPYHYWRYTKNYLNQGFITDSMTEDDLYVDELMFAPHGRVSERQTLHPIYSAWTYKFLSIFSDVSPYWVFFMMPALAGMLTVIPAFFIGRKFGGNLAGAVAGLVMAVHPSFIGRSVGGFSSTDSYNLLFPLLIFWLAIEAFDTKNNWLRLTYGSLAGLLMGIFSRTWSAWSSMYVMILIILLGYLLYVTLKHFLFEGKKQLYNIKRAGIITGSFFLSSAVFISLFTGFSAFIRFLETGLFRRLGLQQTLGAGLWPNVMTTVAELNRPSIPNIISSVGGEVLFFIAILGLCLTLVPLKNWRAQDYYYISASAFLAFLALTDVPRGLANVTGISQGVMFTFFVALPVLAGFALKLFDDRSFNIVFAMFASGWFIATIFMSTQGVRFILLLVPAFAIALAVFFGRLLLLLKEQFSKGRWGTSLLRTSAGYFIVILVGLFLLTSLVNDGYAAGFNRPPSMHDAWYDTLTEIKETTDEDAIITSWWDFGHWFKAIAERRVTFDGASQNTPMAHWTGRALLTKDESEARSIIRMLHCGGREGFEALSDGMYGSYDNLSPREFFLVKEVFDDGLAVDNYNEAVSIYSQHADNAEEIASLTHCDAPEGLFITSGDMVGKASVWGHFGGWSFEKAYIVADLRRRPIQEAMVEIQEILDVSENEARTLYLEANSLVGQRATNDWISSYPSYYMNSVVSCQDEGNEIICPTQINLGSQNGQAIILSGVVINLDNPEESHLALNFVDPSTGASLGRQRIALAGYLINGDLTSITETADLEAYADIRGEPGSYRMLLSHPRLAGSVFSNLYFWDESDVFEKIIDRDSEISNEKIKVWRVVY